MRVRHPPVGLNIVDDLTVIVADLQAAHARVVDGPGLLPLLIRNQGSVGIS